MIMIGFETPPFTNVSCTTTSYWCSIETWTTLVCLYIGTLFYALLISNVSSMVAQLNQAKKAFEEKLMEVNEYMVDKKLPSDLRERGEGVRVAKRVCSVAVANHIAVSNA